MDIAALRAGLPAALARAADDYERHLSLERNRSPHTVRAYTADAVGLLDHLARLGGRSPAIPRSENSGQWPPPHRWATRKGVEAHSVSSGVT